MLSFLIAESKGAQKVSNMGVMYLMRVAAMPNNLQEANQVICSVRLWALSVA